MLYLFTFMSQGWALQVPENSKINQSDRQWRLEPTLEIGFLAPLSHKIKFGKDGTDFDYIGDGGQDNLFRYTRWEMNFRIRAKTIPRWSRRGPWAAVPCSQPESYCSSRSMLVCQDHDCLPRS